MMHEGNASSELQFRLQPAQGSHKDASEGGDDIIQKVYSYMRKKGVLERIREGTQGSCLTQKA